MLSEEQLAELRATADEPDKGCNHVPRSWMRALLDELRAARDVVAVVREFGEESPTGIECAENWYPMLKALAAYDKAVGQ